MSPELEHDLTQLVLHHSTVGGREFQESCLRVAAGYYAPDDLDTFHSVDGLAQAIATALQEIGPMEIKPARLL